MILEKRKHIHVYRQPKIKVENSYLMLRILIRSRNIIYIDKKSEL